MPGESSGFYSCLGIPKGMPNEELVKEKKKIKKKVNVDLQKRLVKIIRVVLPGGIKRDYPDSLPVHLSLS